MSKVLIVNSYYLPGYRSGRPQQTVQNICDVFGIPTMRENFGHVIYEALAGGCLPVIFDTTPRKDFGEKQCGNVIKLDDINKFRVVIQAYLDMSSEELLKMKMNAVDYAERKYKKSIETSGYKAIFDVSVFNMEEVQLSRIIWVFTNQIVNTCDYTDNLLAV